MINTKRVSFRATEYIQIGTYTYIEYLDDEDLNFESMKVIVFPYDYQLYAPGVLRSTILKEDLE
jgi:hypothetical protein